jgi:hypothetical protein
MFATFVLVYSIYRHPPPIYQLTAAAVRAMRNTAHSSIGAWRAGAFRNKGSLSLYQHKVALFRKDCRS